MKQLSELHALAKAYEGEIKAAVAERFSVSVDTLVPLIDKEVGVFISELDASCFCCLVVSKEDGHLYSVVAHIDREHTKLTNFNAIPVY